MDGLVQDAREAFDDAQAARSGGDKRADEEVLSAAAEAFEEVVKEESDNRREALDDVRFARLGEQWPEQIRAEREKAQRPCLTINRLPAFIRQVVNDGRQNRPSIKVRPADSSGDPSTAEVMTGLIRNIEQTSSADVAYDTGLECAVDRGFGYWRVAIEHSYDDTFDLDLRIKRVANPFTVYGDPRSMGADSSDWNSAFVTEMIPLERFKETYRGADTSSWQSGGYDDLSADWRDGDEVRVAEWWRREQERGRVLMLSGGQMVDAKVYQQQAQLFQAAGLMVVGEREVTRHRVTQYLLTGAEVLRQSSWPGCYIPIVPVYGDEVIVDGKRHLRSLIRDAKDPQRQYNYWRTTTTELLALAPRAPWIGPKGFAKHNPEAWATANSASHPYLEYEGPTPPMRTPFDGPPAGALQEALNASDDMKSVMGLFDASLGARSNETSGVAIQARQREGDVSTFHFTDNLTRAIRHTGRILIDLIPYIYTGPRIVRVIGQDGTPTTVPVNQQVQMPDGSLGIYDLTAGKYDLVAEAGPSYTTKRQEAAAQMVEFMRVQPQAGALIGDLLVKALDWPGADEIAARLKAMLPPQLQGQPDPMLQQAQQQMQQMQQQMQQMQQQTQQQIQQLQIENAKLQLAVANKQGELAVSNRELEIRAQEVQARAQADMAKAAAGVEEARIEAMGEAIVARIESQMQPLAERVGTVAQAIERPPEVAPPDPMDAAMKVAMLSAMERMAAPQSKQITIQAPSGRVYQAVIAGDQARVTEQPPQSTI